MPSCIKQFLLNRCIFYECRICEKSSCITNMSVLHYGHKLHQDDDLQRESLTNAALTVYENFWINLRVLVLRSFWKRLS